MKNSFTSGLTSFVSVSVKFILIAILCVAFAFAIVFPFWFFADKVPSVYSIVILSLFACFIVYLIISSIYKKVHGKTPSEKQIFLFNFFRSFILILLSLIALTVTVVLVLSYHRLAGLLIFVLSFIAVGVLAFSVKKK